MQLNSSGTIGSAGTLTTSLAHVSGSVQAEEGAITIALHRLQDLAQELDNHVGVLGSALAPILHPGASDACSKAEAHPVPVADKAHTIADQLDGILSYVKDLTSRVAL